MYSLQELEAFLTNEGADFQLIGQERPIRSTDDGKSYYDMEKAAPTFVLQTENGLIACIVSGNRGRLDFEAMKQKLGFSKLKLADKKKIQRQTGYRVGAIPLIGLGLDCVFDDTLLAYDFIYGGTGDELVTLKIKPEDVKRLNKVIGTL